MKPKEKIIFALQELLEQDDLEITTKNIATQAQYSEAMIYQNFKAKHEMLTALLLHHQKTLENMFTDKCEQFSKGSDQIKNMLKGLFQYAQTYRGFVRLLFYQCRGKSEYGFKESINLFYQFLKDSFKNPIKLYMQEANKFQYPEESTNDAIVSFIYGQLYIYNTNSKLLPTNRFDLKIDRII